MQLGLRGRCRHLQVDERRRQLDEARGRLRRQLDQLVRHARTGRVPRAGHQRDRGRPDECEPHLRRLGPGRSRPLARDRQRRHDAPRAGGERTRTVRVQRRGQDLHRGLERQRQRLVRRHRRRARPARSEHRLRGGVRPRAVEAVDRARRVDLADGLPPGLRSPLPRWRNRPDDGRPHREERQDPPLPDRRDGEPERDPRGQRLRVLANRQRQPACRDPPRLAGGGDDGACRQREPVPGHLQQLAAADLANDVQPILRDGRLLHRSVLVRQRGLHAGGQARHGLRDRLIPLRRAALQHEGRGVRQRSLQRPRRPLLGHRR